MNRKHFIYSILLILLLIVAVAGWFATDYLGNKARLEIVKENQSSVLTLSTYISSTLTTIEGAVKSLSGSPWIAPALLSKGDQDIEHANSALDRYNSALNASVSYLMDVNGMTVASSNREDPDSFIGKSYRFRPYFLEAARGQPYHYFALGITSGKRGFYASYPVKNSLGKVLGVVTMKKDLDDIGIFFRKYPFCFFISPEGIIFLSSKPEMVLKSFWPLDKAAQEKLLASQQFGNKLSEAVTEKEIADGTEVTFEGKDYFVSRNTIDSDGWSIVLLNPTDRVWIYKLTGILATIFVCLLIMVFTGTLYLTERSNEAIRQSEERKHLLLHAAGDGIFGVDATGRTTFVNPAALRMLGFAEEEMLAQSVHALIHHSHKDGSNYPVDDCPMYASYTKAVDRHVEDEVLWRKEGSYFHVDYFSTPIIKDGKVEGAVVTFHDITERKQLENTQTFLLSCGSPGSGEDFFKTLAPFLATSLGMDYVCIDRLTGDGLNAETEAIYNDGKFDTNVTYTLKDTPCGDVVGKTICCFPRDVRALFPNDAALQDLKSESYIGTTLWSYDGKPIGLIAVISRKPMANPGLAEAILKMVAIRAAGELERKQGDEALRESEERYRLVMDNINDAVFICKFDGHLKYMSPSMVRITGYSSNEMLNEHYLHFIHPEFRKRELELYIKQVQENIEVTEHEYPFLAKGGGIIWVGQTARMARNNKGEIEFFGVIRDITGRKQTEEALKEREERYRELSIIDDLTQLYNSRHFYNQLKMEIDRVNRYKESMTIILLDMDNFKAFNDNYGHIEGDHVLMRLGQVIKRCLRKTDTAYRYGGEEFIILLPMTTCEDGVITAERIRAEFKKENFSPESDKEIHMTLSFGVGQYKPQEEMKVFVHRVDQLMYQAKKKGKDRVCYVL